MPERTAKVLVVVTGGPEGRKAERRCGFTVEDGRVADADAFTDVEADLVITQPFDDAVAAADGSTPLDEAFMRGTTKVVGSTGLLMDLLPELRSVAARTAP